MNTSEEFDNIKVLTLCLVYYGTDIDISMTLLLFLVELTTDIRSKEVFCMSSVADDEASEGPRLHSIMGVHNSFVSLIREGPKLT